MQTCFAYVGSYTAPERQGRGNGINVAPAPSTMSSAFHSWRTRHSWR
jgi:hypothetical protein